MDKSGSDEISTYDTGFVGVDLPVLTSLPRMLEAEKEQILGKNNSEAKPAAWSRAGVSTLLAGSKVLASAVLLQRVQLIGQRSVAFTIIHLCTVCLLLVQFSFSIKPLCQSSFELKLLEGDGNTL